MNQKSTETFRIEGGEIISKLKALVHEGNIRKIVVQGKDGRTIAEFPMTVGVVGAVLAPPLAAIGAIAALVSDCTIVVEKTQDA